LPTRPPAQCHHQWWRPRVAAAVSIRRRTRCEEAGARVASPAVAERRTSGRSLVTCSDRRSVRGTPCKCTWCRVLVYLSCFPERRRTHRPAPEGFIESDRWRGNRRTDCFRHRAVIDALSAGLCGGELL